jgi:imidazolonepropionase-like amidohydrolase
MEGFVLREAQVLDESGGFSGPLDVHVEAGRIASVGRGVTADAPSYDFSGLWLMPGMFDCHLHVAFSTFDIAERLRQPLTEWVLQTAATCRTTLEAGVTFVRDCVGADAGMRAAIARGLVPGPTLQVSIVAIIQTGGHGDGFLAGPGFETLIMLPSYPGRPPYMANGADQVRETVRAVLRAGADFIKLCTTGGLLSEHDEPLVAELTFEEIETAVMEARRKGKPVATHAFGGEGLENSVRAGVRSIEHGWFLTEEQAALMAERGCWLVPTLAIMRDDLRWAQEGKLSPASCRKVLDLDLDFGGCVRLAKEHGVRIAAGTDYISRDQHGHNLEELALLHQAGLTVGEALLAGTAGGAELCGVEDEYGRIAPGYIFDAIVLDEDPGDLSRFGQPGVVTGVFKGGAPVVHHERLGWPQSVNLDRWSRRG